MVLKSDNYNNCWGEKENIDEQFELEIYSKKRIRKIGTLVFDNLPEDLILGMNFIQEGQFVIDFADSTWYYPDEIDTKYSYVLVQNLIGISLVCCSLRTMEESEVQKLNQLLDRLLLPAVENDHLFPVTTLYKHSMNTRENKPIRKNPYRASPALYEVMDKGINLYYSRK